MNKKFFATLLLSTVFIFVAPSINANAHPIDSSHNDPYYYDELNKWINEALYILDINDIPGTYDGIYRNIIRESSGDPNAINLWDVNAQNGIPSKGLLQVIDPTFEAYYVQGTEFNVWNPVSNIVAACNYAAARYGSIDNVYGAY